MSESSFPAAGEGASGEFAQGSGAPCATEPVFSVLDVGAVPYAAVPTLAFAMHVSDPSGRSVHTMALSVQVMFEPAKRIYDDATRARLVDLFGAPERWAATTHPFQWSRVDVLVPGFTGATSFSLELPCSYDLDLAAARFIHSLPDGEVPLAFHFTGMVLHAAEHDRLQVAQVPWSCSARWRMPVGAWREAIRAIYPAGGWVRLTQPTLDALLARKAAAGDHDLDTTVAHLLGEAASVSRGALATASLALGADRP